MTLTKTTATYNDYSIKYFEYDTIINNLNYKKYRWETFKNSTENKEISYEYEFIGKDSYSLLDQNLTEAHSFKFDKKPQKGKIFYKEGIILYDFIKGQEFPTGVEVEYEKYTFSDNEYTYALFDRRDFSVGATSYDKDVRFILQGEKIEMINNALNNVNYFPTAPSFKKIGDKIQYEVWSTVVKFAGKIEFKKEGKELEDPIKLNKKSYEVEDIITQEYVSDTIINEKEYKRLHGIKKDVKTEIEERLVTHIHIQNGALEIRQGESEIVVKYSLGEPILDIDSNIMTFTGAMDYDFNGYDLTEFVYWGFRGNETTVKFLSQFPCPMVEMWGHDNKITYLKINGEEYGELK